MLSRARIHAGDPHAVVATEAAVESCIQLFLTEVIGSDGDLKGDAKWGRYYNLTTQSSNTHQTVSIRTNQQAQK